MAENKIGRAALIVEIDGVPRQVCIPKDRMPVLLRLASGLCDSGNLTVSQPCSGIKFLNEEEIAP